MIRLNSPWFIALIIAMGVYSYKCHADFALGYIMGAGSCETNESMQNKINQLNSDLQSCKGQNTALMDMIKKYQQERINK